MEKNQIAYKHRIVAKHGDAIPDWLIISEVSKTWKIFYFVTYSNMTNIKIFTRKAMYIIIYPRYGSVHKVPPKVK